MEKKIDRIILKAETIEDFLNKQNMPKGNIKQLIECLKSYRDTVGDIGPEKRFYISGCDVGQGKLRESINFEVPIGVFEYYHKGTFATELHRDRSLVYIESLDFTTHIRETVFTPYPDVSIYSLPPETIENPIADAVWDVQTFKVDNPYLIAMLVDKGLKPINTNIKWIRDFA